MDDAARARAAARDAIDDIVLERLHDLIDRRLATAKATPGVLTRIAARASDRGGDPDEVDRRTAGVQLIYDGLAVTRTLARDPPWEEDDDATDANMDILAADVAVGRGFFLLARTEAAPTAVETVRRFGRDETLRAASVPADATAERSLEADVFELAIVAGVTATGRDPPEGTGRFARDLAKSFDPESRDGSELRVDVTVEALEELLADRDPTGYSPDRIWAGSTTDP